MAWSFRAKGMDFPLNRFASARKGPFVRNRGKNNRGLR
jgi:hypothetical protein